MIALPRLTAPVPVPSAPAPSAPAAPAPTPAAETPKDTPYQKIKNSTVGKFVRNNKVVTGVATVGSTIVLAGGSASYPAFGTLTRNGIVPAAAAGVAVVGAAAVHDAIVNDFGKHNARATLKVVVGGTAALGGTQVVGWTYGIPYLDNALTGTLEHIGRNAEALGGAAVLAGGVAAGKFAIGRFQAAATQADHRPANALLGVTSAAGSVGGVLGGLELIGRQYDIAGLDRVFTNTIDMLGHTGVGSLAGGGLLLAGAGVLAGEAAQNVRSGGNDFLTVAEGMGAVATGLGGAELLGHGLGVTALQGLFTQHLGTIGAAAMTSTGVAMTRASVASARADGMTGKNTLVGTAGATLGVGGVAVGAETLGLSSAASFLGHGTAVVGGLGLGALTGVLGRNAVNNFRKGDVINGTANAVGTLFTGSASVGLIGEGLGIEAVSKVADQMYHHTVVPLFDHVVEPAARFLFENPVAGAVVIAVGVGAYAWYKHKHGGLKKP